MELAVAAAEARGGEDVTPGLADGREADDPGRTPPAEGVRGPPRRDGAPGPAAVKTICGAVEARFSGWGRVGSASAGLSRRGFVSYLRFNQLELSKEMEKKGEVLE